MIDILICISLLCCIIGFVISTIDYINSNRIFKQYYKKLTKEEYKKLKEKEKEHDSYYGLFH